MKESGLVTVSQVIGLSNDYGGNKVSTVGKMMMGPASKKNRKKAPKASGSNRFPLPMRKGM